MVTRIPLSNRRRLLTEWFLIGFVVRFAFAVVITLLMARDFEAVMLYLVDLPTIWCLDIVERLFSSVVAKQLSGNHPYYVTFNILGSFMWGFLFALASFAISSLRARRHIASSE
jgi:hypothetical protein